MVIWKVLGVVFCVIFIQSFVNASANSDSWIGSNTPFGDLTTSAAENLARNLYPERVMQNPEPIQGRAEGQNIISSNLLGGIMRMMGMDSGKLGALVINGLIFLAQMVKNATGYLTRVTKDWKVTYEQGSKEQMKLSSTGFTGLSMYTKPV